MKKIYILIMIIEKNESFSIEPIGVYSSLKRATKNRKECKRYISPTNEKNTIFEIMDFELNEDAKFLTLLTLMIKFILEWVQPKM